MYNWVVLWFWTTYRWTFSAAKFLWFEGEILSSRASCTSWLSYPATNRINKPNKPQHSIILYIYIMRKSSTTRRKDRNQPIWQFWGIVHDLSRRNSQDGSWIIWCSYLFAGLDSVFHGAAHSRCVCLIFFCDIGFSVIISQSQNRTKISSPMYVLIHCCKHSWLAFLC